MPKRPSPTKRRAQVGGLLWVRSIHDQRAPDELGGQTVEEQERLVREQMERDHRSPDRMLYRIGPAAVDSNDLLEILLGILEQTRIQHVFVAGAIYAQCSEDELMEHRYVLLRHGFMLTICDDE
ncbi:hypothetical protein [Microbacterium capsulatum]|uniref:Uncharacterized protein n=1 Tax=Microbacterium capsulatum TaxID=3041921 RepID=A0ABU0XF76_9MICO|nr:hypothetical protein [Microbacterium sp. ASV81]MDQ4213748.1 hypothetical protein [Microbacterium sp. ASV81]